MKYLVLIGDGMADHPLEVLGGRTPLEAADAPALDALVARGMVGQYCPIPEGMPPGSDVGNLTLFGYNPRETFTGRAPSRRRTRASSSRTTRWPSAATWSP